MTVANLKTEIDWTVSALGSADVAALVATKLRCIAPMIAVYQTAYLGLSIQPRNRVIVRREIEGNGPILQLDHTRGPEDPGEPTT